MTNEIKWKYVVINLASKWIYNGLLMSILCSGDIVDAKSNEYVFPEL